MKKITFYLFTLVLLSTLSVHAQKSKSSALNVLTPSFMELVKATKAVNFMEGEMVFTTEASFGPDDYALFTKAYNARLIKPMSKDIARSLALLIMEEPSIQGEAGLEKDKPNILLTPEGAVVITWIGTKWQADYKKGKYKPSWGKTGNKFFMGR